ncbi:MAG: hypothetical protein GY906_02800 [bacterium]|nr:hypothetical protein [bacterium]
MPHLKLEGKTALDEVLAGLTTEVHRWGRAVLKVDACWLRVDRQALLIEGVVVEHSRPLHPVVMVALQPGHTVIRLWPTVSVERTSAVRRLLGLVGVQLQGLGAGPVVVTNIDLADLDGLPLSFADSECDSMPPAST